MTDEAAGATTGRLVDEFAAAPSSAGERLDRCQTGVSGFDQLTLGGLPRGRTTLVTGPAGSGKTVLAAQFLLAGARGGEPGIFVTFEEPADDLRRNLASFGWPIQQLEQDSAWRFVDASPISTAHPDAVTDFDLVAEKVAREVDRVTARRVVLDSVSAVFEGTPDRPGLRQQLRRFLYELRRLQLTVVMTMEARGGSGELAAPLGFEEFLADNVIVLRNTLDEEKRRRTRYSRCAAPRTAAASSPSPCSPGRASWSCRCRWSTSHTSPR